MVKMYNIFQFWETNEIKFIAKYSMVNWCFIHWVLLGPRDRDYPIGSNFWKFYLIRTGFTFRELVSLVKVFRLFQLERSFWVLRVWTQWVSQCRASCLLAGPVCLWCLVSKHVGFRST
jgi:hypothetical protein